MTYVDCRDWSDYNEALVRRGEILLGLDAVEDWEEELEQMNRDKEGARFRFPDSLILLLAFIRILFHLPYRQTEGFLKTLSRHITGLVAPDYSTLNRRINRLEPKRLDVNLNDMEEPVTIAVDASGVKVTNSGDWIRRRWKVRKGFLKIHVAVDVKTKQILALKVTSEKVGDNRKFKPLVKEAAKRCTIRRVLGDGAYDAKANFNFLAQRGIEAAIRVRSSSVPRSRGSWARKQAVLWKPPWMFHRAAWRS